MRTQLYKITRSDVDTILKKIVLATAVDTGRNLSLEFLYNYKNQEYSIIGNGRLVHCSIQQGSMVAAWNATLKAHDLLAENVDKLFKG